MGGSLEVASQLGHGSAFTLKIPAFAPAALVTAARPMTSMQTRVDGHVLLAEDNANIRWLVEEYLRRAGALVTAVANGAQALAAVQRTASRRHFDLILLDINMPGMDGPEAMSRIRALGHTGPIVALTAHSNTVEQRRFLDTGWDAVAPKPINRHTFIPLIARLIEEKRQAAVQQ
jgi:CheY-like chemotaxis protein